MPRLFGLFHKIKETVLKNNKVDERDDEQAVTSATKEVKSSINANKRLFITVLMMTVIEAVAAALIEVSRGQLVKNQTSTAVLAITGVVLTQNWLMLAFYATLKPLAAHMDQYLFIRVFDSISAATRNSLARFHERFGPTTHNMVSSLTRAYATDYPNIFNGAIIILGQMVVIGWAFGLKYLCIAVLGVVSIFALTPIQVWVDRKLANEQKRIENEKNSHFNEIVKSIKVHQTMGTLKVKRNEQEQLHQKAIRLQFKYLLPSILCTGVGRLLPVFITVSWSLLEVLRDNLHPGMLVMLYGLLYTSMLVTYTSLQVFRNLKGNLWGQLTHFGTARSLPSTPTGMEVIAESTDFRVPAPFRVERSTEHDAEERQSPTSTIFFSRGLMAENLKRYRSLPPEVRIDPTVGLLVRSGATLVIIGESGSGKTTLLDAITGNLTPEELLGGEVQYRTSDNRWVNRSEIKCPNDSIIPIPQEANEFWVTGTVEDNLMLPFLWLKQFPPEKSERIIRAALRVAGLPDEADIESAKQAIVQKALQVVRLSETKLHQKGASGGERTRTVVARAVVRMYLVIAVEKHRPIMVADEITSNLDPKSKREMMEGLDQETDRLGVTFVITTHDEKVIPGTATGIVLGSVDEGTFAIVAVGPVNVLRRMDETYRNIYDIS
ncbi:ABC transporter [Seinonella peptonophila]|uniref:ABC transporter n=1 Tax=Seinonella peptonophila TaxID=112248 RepID=A0A1M4Z369_9BACL|nr:ABC transporter ATP-binding protein/permease [Seinonella peptonophila]SHF12513.1 ABC transporter [Seinonella peptonophila]